MLHHTTKLGFIPRKFNARPAMPGKSTEALDVKVQTETASASAEKRWYDANCHCRAVRYRMKLPPLYPDRELDTLEPSISDQAEREAQRHQVTICNCSICTKNGTLSVYPSHSELEFLQGQDGMTSYQFGNKSATHKFCKMCGSSLMVQIQLGGMEKIAMNVCRLRTLIGLDCNANDIP